MPEQPIFTCERLCPGRAAADLGALAARFVPAESWLYDQVQTPGQPVFFSEDAMRIANTHFRTQLPPDDAYYGDTTYKKSQDAKVLEFMRAGIYASVRLEPKSIATLVEIAANRDAAVQEFANMPEQDKLKVREQTRPFLERLSVEVFEGEVRPLQQALSDEEYSQLEFRFPGETALHKAHELDQLPFIVAREALEKCGAPMALVKKRPFSPERIVPICPYGKRNTAYYEAEFQAENAPTAQPPNPPKN